MSSGWLCRKCQQMNAAWCAECGRCGYESPAATPHDAAPADRIGPIGDAGWRDDALVRATASDERVSIVAAANGPERDFVPPTPSRAAGTEAVQAGDAVSDILRAMNAQSSYAMVDGLGHVPARLVSQWHMQLTEALASPPSVAVAQEAAGWSRLVAAFIAQGLPEPMRAGQIPLWPNADWTQDQAMIAFALHRTAHPEAAKDAERYGWLRFADLDEMAAKYWPNGQVPTGDDFDAAVDAALASSKSQGREA
jgi:hypothetical protein